MKAAVLNEIAEPIRIEEVATPKPGAGELLIKVVVCGICHSDLHLALGEMDLLKSITKVPLILGHEVTGTVAAIGDGVTDFKIGDRVGVPWIHYTCDECEFCSNGRETLCPNQQITGCTVDGGFAEYIKSKASHTARLPDELSFEQAAPLLCAGLTVYTAIKTSEIQPGMKVAIFGVGGLGHIAIQIVRNLGAEVVAVDISEDKLKFARELGAEFTVLATTEQAHREIRKSTGGGVHVALVTSGSRAAYEIALRSLRRGGTLSIIGLSPEPIPVSTMSMVSGEYRIVASAVGTRQDLKEVLDLAAQGKVKCHVGTCSMEEISSVFEDMKSGSLTGRMVMKL